MQTRKYSNSWNHIQNLLNHKNFANRSRSRSGDQTRGITASIVANICERVNEQAWSRNIANSFANIFEATIVFPPFSSRIYMLRSRRRSFLFHAFFFAKHIFSCFVDRNRFIEKRWRRQRRWCMHRTSRSHGGMRPPCYFIEGFARFSQSILRDRSFYKNIFPLIYFNINFNVFY